MSRDALDELYDGFTASVFRLETLQAYSVGAYDERLRVFTQEGRLLPAPTPKREWIEFVRERTAAGRLIHRVHVVDEPLTPYLRFELAEYRENVVAGEAVRIADRAGHPALEELRRDFILFDADTGHAAVVWFRYSPAGELIGRDVSTDQADVDLCREQSDLALAHSVPLDELAARAA